MLALTFASFLLSNAWPSSTIGPPVPRDVNGVIITVGATIKLVGTVLSVSATDGHGMGIVFQPLNPAGNITPAQQANYLMPVSPLPGKPMFKADPSQLIVGS